MQKEDGIDDIAEKLRAYLGTEFKPVGITLYADGMPGPHPPEPATFCNLVREAAQGKEFLITEDDFLCFNAQLPLGVVQPNYVNIEPRIKSEIRSIRIGSLEACDVVLLILNPEQLMIVSSLLGGIEATFKGDMAVCGEAVAQVYNTGRPNVSFLCMGARTLGGFQPVEMVLGIPRTIFMTLGDRMTHRASLSQEARAKAASLVLKHSR
ncbi:MAG: DUF169 domain-containing protein [Chloroflexota bacterium]